MPSASWSEPVTLGQTGITTSRLGLSSGYGIGASEVARAYERGVRYFYFGSRRTSDFAKGFASLDAAKREHSTVVVQSYSRAAWMIRGSLERALRSLRTDRADFLLLGWWNRVPTERILDAALALKDSGLVRRILISSHARPTLVKLGADPRVDAIMLRYNAAHPGCEREVFPSLGPRETRRAGVVAYTATRWGMLLDPKRTPPGEPTPRASDCYRFALSSPSVNVCTVGPKNAAELDEALATIDRGPLSPDELAWMKRVGVFVRDGAKGAPRGMAMGLVDRLCAT